MAKDLHPNIIDQDEIHVAKGFTEASLDTVMTKNSSGVTEWAPKSDVGGSQGIPGEKGDSINIAQVVIVQKDPQLGQFADIPSALASITDASASKPYRIVVGPGVYISAVINCKAHVDICGSGFNNTILQPINPSVNFIIGAADSVMCGVTISECVAASGVYVGISTSKFYLEGCLLTNNQIHVEIQAVAGSRSRADLWKCTLKGTSDFCFKVTSTATIQAKVVITECITEAQGAGGHGIFATGELTTVVLSGGEMDGEGVGDVGLILQDGAIIESFSIEFERWVTAIQTLNVGVAPTLIMAGILMEANTQDIDIQHPGTKGILQGVAHGDKISIINTSPFTVNISEFDAATGESGAVALGAFRIGTEIDNLLDLTFITNKSMPLGLYTSHDVLTDGGGTIVNIESGRRGYMEVPGSPDKYYEVDVDDTPIDVDIAGVGVDVYLIVNENGTVTPASTFSNSRYQLVLGRVVTDGTSILFIENTAIRGYHANNNNLEFVREAFGSLYVSGSQTIETPTVPHNLNVSQGVYWFSHNRLAPVGGDQITFNQHFRDGSGDWSRSLTQTVNNTHYDNNTGILEALTAGYFAKHYLFVTGDGAFEKYFLQLGQTEYADLPTAQQGTPPTPPSYFKDAVVRIFAIIVQQGAANIIELDDQRPTLSFTAAGGGGGATSHSDLFGLDNPGDHDWAVTLDGSRVFTANQSMGGFALTNVSNVNGVVIQTHASRHAPNGADPLPTGTASDINKTNAEGNANAFARQNHTHRVLLDKLGSDEMTMQDMHNWFHSAGIISGFVITDNLNGTGNISAGKLAIRATSDPLTDVFYVTIPAQTNVAFAIDDRTFIYVDYNAGSPQLIYSAAEINDHHTKVYVATLFNDGDTQLHISPYDGTVVGDHAVLMALRAIRTEPNKREQNGGADTAETGTRNFTVSVGKFWQGLQRFTTPAFDTSGADEFDLEYRDGFGDWSKLLGQTQINNLNYDNNTGTLGVLTDGNYGVHWLYLESDDGMDVILGQGDYATPADARAAAAPSILPPHLEGHAIIIAKIIIQKNSATFFEILNAFDDDLSSASVAAHGGLSGLNDPNGHPWAFNIDGSKAMTNTFDVGNQDIDNIRNFLSGFGVKLPADANIVIDGDTFPRAITKGVMRFLHKPIIPSTRVLNMELDANGQNDSMAMVVNYKATGLGVGDVGMLLEGNINTNNSTGGTIGGMRISKNGAGLVEVRAVETDPGVHPLSQAVGTFGAVDNAFIFDGGWTDTTSNFSSPVSNVGIFQNVGDFGYWGHATMFEAIEAIMDTVSSEDITGIYEYSDGVGGWLPFGPNDNSNGYTINGLITWTAAALVGWAQDTVNLVSGKYWIRCQRSRTTITTPPIEQTLNIASLTYYGWDDVGDLTIKLVNGVAPQAHIARHQPGGADAMPTAVAVNTGITNAVGTSTSLSRADHVHNTEIARSGLEVATQFQTTSPTDVIITSFVLTPPAGTFSVWANFQSQNSGNTNVASFSFYKNTIHIPTSQRDHGMESNGTPKQISIQTRNVAFNGTTDTIEVRVKTTGGTLTIDNRIIELLRVGA